MPTGSRKTTVYQFLLRILQQIRQAVHLDSSCEPIWQLQDATFEKMGALMAESNGRLLGMFDELTALLTKLKLYNNRDLSDSHELAMFLELYNGNSWTRATVTGEANFSMERTSLTVGGFNQPAVARYLLEMSGNAEKGLSQRFLWLFPKPVYGEFKTLEPSNQEFTDKIVAKLAKLWKKSTVKDIETTTYHLPDDDAQMATFVEKYDKVQKQLETVAAMDDLLSGMLSKSLGQTLRISVAMHILFHDDDDGPLSDIITQAAIEAAIDFVEVCCQHTAYIAGHGNIDEQLKLLETGSFEEIPQTSLAQKSTEAFILTLPGKCLDVSTLVNIKKKFRNRGSREGALHAMQQLTKDGIGELREKKEQRLCEGIYGTAHHVPPPILAVEDQQLRQLSSKDHNHVLNNTKQESQIRMAAEQELQIGMVKPKEAFSGSRSPCVVTGCYGSSHHIPGLPPLIEHEDQQQYIHENDNVFDKEHESEVQDETQTETHSGFTDIVTCTGSCGSIHQVCSSSSSLQDEDQQQQAIRSNLVIGSSGERKDTKQKQRSQNQAAVQEEDQHVIHLDSVFGCDLTELVNAEGGVVPKFLIKCVEEIEKRGLMVPDIYHLSGSAEQIVNLQQRINQDLPVDFADQEWGDIHIISGALKLFLKELPDSLIPFSLYNKLTNAGKLKPPHNIAKLKLFIRELPTANYETVKKLCDHLRKVMKYSSVNKMQSVNLATVFGPLIPIHSKVMEAFLNDYDIIFGQF